MRASDGAMTRYAPRCLDSMDGSMLVNVGRSLWVRVKKIINGIGSLFVHVLICFNILVDKDIDLELVMFTCMIFISCLYLVQTH